VPQLPYGAAVPFNIFVI